MRPAFPIVLLPAAVFVFACETAPVSPEATPALAIPSASTSSAPSTGCPTDAPDHSSPCTSPGLRCEWDFRTVGKVSAFCDGNLWRVARRDSGCPASAATGGVCGQFAGSCSYLVDDAYPTPTGPRADKCVLRCDCYGGKWTCSNSCTCPGTNVSDPFHDGFDGLEFARGCLHPDMRCDYACDAGTPSDDVAAQACRTSYTCSATSWTRQNVCGCPAFRPGATVVPQECHSDPTLQCSFPPNFDGGPSRNCRCENERWSCD